MNIAIYIRVSTQEQAREGYSIGEQKERLSLYAKAHSWTIVKTYIDPGFSGGSLDRPAMQDMIRDAKAHLFAKVVVYKLDRLSRSQKDTLYLIEDVFLASGVDFVSMTENFDTASPFGKAMIGMLSVFAQLEREQIRERMSLGHDARAKDGFFHGGGYAPIGYDYIDGDLVVNEYEAIQIRKIYDLAEAGMPTNAIAKRMTGFSHRFGRWTSHAVRSTLTSQILTGVICWKGAVYPGRHDAIITPERFDRMQERLDLRRTQFPKHPFMRTTLLGGLIFCGRCGARYFCKQNSSRRGTPQKYYTCYSRGKTASNMIRDPNCKNKTWNVKELDALILGEIRKLAVDPAAFDAAAAPEKNTAGTEKRLREIEKQSERLLDLYQTGRFDVLTLEKRLNALNTEKAALTAEIDDLPALPIPDAQEMLLTFPEALDNSDDDTIRQIVHGLIDAIIIDGDDVEIHWLFS